MTACSSFKIIYNLAENFIKEETKFYLKFDEEDEYYLNAQINQMMEWHNITMLPRYAAYLRNQANQIDKEIYGKPVIIQAIEGGRVLMGDAVRGAAPFAARILVRQKATANLEHLRTKMNERIEEKKEKLADPRERRITNRTRRLIKNIGRFLGDFNQTQNNLIRNYSRSTIDDGHARLKNRDLRQRELLKFLVTKPNEIELEEFINKILLRSHEIVDPDYQKASKDSIDKFATVLTNILAASTPDQRRLAAKNLRNLAQDLMELAS